MALFRVIIKWTEDIILFKGCKQADRAPDGKW